MKKFIFVLCAVFVMMSNITYAIDPITCFNCQSNVIGELHYDKSATEDVVFNYQTNVGYVTDGVNPNGLIMNLHDCENVGDLLSTTEYDILIEIKTDGVYFSDPAEDATEVSIAITNYTTSDEVCEWSDEVYTTIDCSISEDNKKCYSINEQTFLESGKVYFKIVLPELYYNPSEINPLNDVVVRVAINEADKICVVCDDAICDCKKTIASFKIDVYDSTLQYIIVDNQEWWSGIALTNYNDTVAITKLILVSDEETVQEQVVNIPANQVKTFIASELFDNCEIGYLNIQSSNDIDALCILGSNVGVYGYQSNKK